MSSLRTKWEDFFIQAGVPNEPALEYAAIFSDNRMQFHMLNELNKDLLLDLGLKAMGDIISILRYSKIKHDQIKRQRYSSPEITVIEKPKISPNMIPVKRQSFKISTKVSPSDKPASVTKAEIVKTLSTNKARAVHQPASQETLEKSVRAKMNTQLVAVKVKSKKRKTLSDRFHDFEVEQKRPKQDESEKGKSSTKLIPHEQSSITQNRNKRTSFTIKVPSVKPSRTVNVSSLDNQKVPTANFHIAPSKEQKQHKKDEDEKGKSSLTVTPYEKTNTRNKGTTFHMTSSIPISKPKIIFKVNDCDTNNISKKVTLVPAQRKQVVRTKLTASIFDRLDEPSPKRESAKIDMSAKDSNVFNRLGIMTVSQTPLKVQKVTAAVRDPTKKVELSEHLSSTSNNKSVFSRLGG